MCGGAAIRSFMCLWCWLRRCISLGLWVRMIIITIIELEGEVARGGVDRGGISLRRDTVSMVGGCSFCLLPCWDCVHIYGPMRLDRVTGRRGGHEERGGQEKRSFILRCVYVGL